MSDDTFFFIDRFSSLDRLSMVQLNDDGIVLRVLRCTPHVSTFEMSENAAVRDAIERLCGNGLIQLNTDKIGYPWIAIEFTEEKEAP
jgi:hypothetical protein